MNLYLISQSVNSGYDFYDSAVVAAINEVAARHIQPSDGLGYSEWAKPENVAAQLIGVACKGTTAGVILASYNAG